MHLSWITALKNQEYLSASETLWNLCTTEPKLKQLEVGLCLAKLAYLEGLESERMEGRKEDGN